MPISHYGNSVYSRPHKNFLFKDTLLVPKITKSLFSIQIFVTDNHFSFEIWPFYFLIKDQKTKEILLCKPSENGFYVFPSVLKQALLGKKVSYEDWNAQLGHPQSRTISQIINKHNFLCSSTKCNHVCLFCSMGKMSRLHLNSTNHISIVSFELVH